MIRTEICLEGDTNFDGLPYANGVELRGKTLGIVGIGRIGQATQRWLLVGMKVIAADSFIPKVDVKYSLMDNQSLLLLYHNL
jgi:D-3-phosphoglycerate dehydrogenase